MEYSETAPLLGSSNTIQYLSSSADELHFAHESIQESYARQDISSLYDSCASETSSQAGEIKYEVYHRRWYILATFSLLCVSNNIIWNTWGPLSDAVDTAWNWKQNEIALLANWGSISYLISVFFFMWLVETKGNAEDFFWISEY